VDAPAGASACGGLITGWVTEIFLYNACQVQSADVERRIHCSTSCTTSLLRAARLSQTVM